MSGRRSRNKGANGERELANHAKATAPDLFPEARRGIGQARSANEVSDVVLDDEHWPEVKRQASPSPRAALKQAIEASEGKNLIPVAITRGDRDEIGWTVTLRWADWVEYVRDRRTLQSVCVRTGEAARAEVEGMP